MHNRYIYKLLLKKGNIVWVINVRVWKRDKIFKNLLNYYINNLICYVIRRKKNHECNKTDK